MFECKKIDLQIPQWDQLVAKSQTATLFQTREWLEVWLKHFSDSTVEISGIFESGDLVAIVPLIKKNTGFEFVGTAEVLGGEFVSDFGDIIISEGKEFEVWKYILTTENKKPFTARFVREDSPSFPILQELAFETEESDVSPYLELPTSWDEYLLQLDRHDRHELRRKLKKLERESVQFIDNPQITDFAEFFRLMSLSSGQKRDFLSEAMKKYFSDLFSQCQKNGMLKLYFLRLGDKNIATTASFVYDNDIFLYNSGFDPEFSFLSPGLTLNALAIKRAIEQKLKRFDFLRGGERYKFDLGAKTKKLYTFKIV